MARFPTVEGREYRLLDSVREFIKVGSIRARLNNAHFKEGILG